MSSFRRGLLAASSTGGGELPVGLQEVEYVKKVEMESQYGIDTQYYYPQNVRFVGKFSLDETFYVWYYQHLIYGNNVEFLLGGGSIHIVAADSVLHSVQFSLIQPHTLDFNVRDDGTITLILDDVQSQLTYSGTLNSRLPVGIGGNRFVGKIYPFKIYDNDELKRDLIPCYTTVPNFIDCSGNMLPQGSKGLYDYVTNKLYTPYNDSDFIAGPDVNN